MANIAFIGLGNMGAPMAINLLKAGHSLRAFDLSGEALRNVVAQGATGCQTAVDTVQDVELLITMLPAGKHVEAVLLTEDGLLDRLPPGTLVIDASTIDAQISRSLAAAAGERRLAFIDAPVSGGTAGAAAGTLTFMVGGSEGDFARALPYLQCMGKNILHAGPSGAGQVTKVCNNMLLGVLMTGTAEALSLGVANGLDPKVLSGIMAQSSGRNWALELYNPYPGVQAGVPASRGYQGGFIVDLMTKDLELAAKAALATRSTTPIGNLTLNLYRLQQGQGKGQLDFSSIIQLFQKD